ncbi:hypothetical protein HU200_015279 [Digitaria exilis]|uniref:Uncharacterized protein n=1 Tax=Digitaria exilis TaxID=1010633 RepID=A0A835KJG8_9POAL|nr:hypothetical protein HU200_015279 [Digitaria exilis]CAB3469550.1 unnamed protein product [Digitaria exilis]
MSMELQILDTLRLSPRTPPQHASLPLSGLDADRNMLDVTFRTLRFFPPPPPSIDPFAVLPRAFASALALFPALAGRVVVVPGDGSHVVVVDAEDTVPFVLAKSELSVADIDADAPASELLDRLAPPSGDDGDVVGGRAPALALRATRFACGGVALGMRVAHALCDGAGATKFLAAAARFARGEGPPDVAPVWDRRELLGPRQPPRVATQVFDRVLALDHDVARRGPYGAAGEQQVTRQCFHVSDANVEALRARLADEVGLRLTTFEVIASFIWRAKVKANGTSSGEVVKMVYSMNISKIINPTLPDGYWGNVCVPVYVAVAAGDLIAQPLATTAAMIKRSKQAVDDEYVRSYIDFLELHRGEGVTAGAAVSAFTDWRRLGHGEVDFGWGEPDVVMPLSWRILGSTEPCFMLPYGAGDERRRRGFKVFVALPRTAVDGFRVEMQELLFQQQKNTVGKL